MAAALDAMTGWSLFAGLILSVGAAGARWLILPRAWPGVDREAPDQAERWATVAAVGLAGAALSVAGVALYFVRQLLEFRDPFVPWSEDASLLLSTPWGTTWKVAVVGTVLLVAAFAMSRSGHRWAWWPATALALGLASFPGLTGHAAGADGGTLALLADWAHVSAAGTWIGGLAVVLVLARRASGSGPQGAEGTDPVARESPLARLVPAFSPVAIASAAVLIVSGTYAAWLHLPGIGALVTTGYGRTLLAKLALVAAVLGFGGRNFRILTPRLGSREGDGAMRRSAALELTFAQVVLIVTALLVRMSPLD